MLFFALSGLINALSSTFVKKFDKFFGFVIEKIEPKSTLISE